MGCKEWGYVTANNAWMWLGKGTLLADGLCIGQEYARYVVPLKGNTTVYTNIAEPKIREISLSDGTISIDFQLTMKWLDPKIKTKFDIDDISSGFIALSKASLNKIWKPDLFIIDSVKPQAELKPSLKRSSALTKHMPGISVGSHAIIETQYEIKSTVYCRFDHSSFPMDQQTCNLTFGSGSFEARFVLYNPDKSSPIHITSESSAFEIDVHLFDNMKKDGSNTIGMRIEIERTLRPFLLKYYVPSNAMVLLSAMSFAVPVTALPGRVGLLVTLFLTLTNLFIHQMVSQI